MPRIPRQLLVDPTEVGIYHCINRCVRRAFLCGRDALTGKSFEHRKEWIQNRLQFLAGQFGIDVLGFAVMSNHLHVVLRNRPDIVRDWSDREVARRWWQLFPTRSDERHEPTESDLGMILNDPQNLAEIRSRLSSIPWFMRCLAEPIARQSNKEDQCTGRFWEGRYKCQPILDESALAACLAYVDLNPIRAGIAKSPATSRFTSVFERLQAQRETAEGRDPALVLAVAANAGKPDSVTSQWTPDDVRDHSGGSAGASPSRKLDSAIAIEPVSTKPAPDRRESQKAALAPAVAANAGKPESEALQCTPDDARDHGGGSAGASPSRKMDSAITAEVPLAKPARDRWLSPLSLSAEITRVPVPAGRASNTGCLDMTLDDYLRLVDWTGRQIRRDQKGAIPADVAPVLDRLQISGVSWLELIRKFGRLFRRAAGRPESLKRDAERRRAKRTEGIVNSRALFA